MKIGVIDADLIGRSKHRFPNLCCMKISGFHKLIGDEVVLKTDYDQLNQFDKVYISKVFLDTLVPDQVLQYPNVTYGGTGFFYDKAEPLPFEIEHCTPDYNLYNTWVQNNISTNKKEFQYYTDYSIGFTTRGCFRQCSFCVNKKYTRVERHSPVDEFVDNNRKYICLLDDNVLGFPQWEEIFNQLNNTNKRFQFKQGMDMRLMTEHKAEIISNSKYIGDFIFAFDHIKDKELIAKKLKIWRKYNQKTTKFYVLCGYEKQDVNDIIDTFERIKLLMQFGCLPYIMRHKNYLESDLKGMYINIAAWCNQPNFFKKKSFREWCMADAERKTNPEKCSTYRYLMEFERQYPKIAKQYFDLKFSDLNSYALK